jgi:hypothetical protein
MNIQNEVEKELKNKKKNKKKLKPLKTTYYRCSG